MTARATAARTDPLPTGRSGLRGPRRERRLASLGDALRQAPRRTAARRRRGDAFSPDGRVVAAAANLGVRLLDGDTLAPLPAGYLPHPTRSRTWPSARTGRSCWSPTRPGPPNSGTWPPASRSARRPCSSERSARSPSPPTARRACAWRPTAPSAAGGAHAVRRAGPRPTGRPRRPDDRAADGRQPGAGHRPERRVAGPPGEAGGRRQHGPGPAAAGRRLARRGRRRRRAGRGRPRGGVAPRPAGRPTERLDHPRPPRPVLAAAGRQDEAAAAYEQAARLARSPATWPTGCGPPPRRTRRPSDTTWGFGAWIVRSSSPRTTGSYAARAALADQAGHAERAAADVDTAVRLGAESTVIVQAVERAVPGRPNPPTGPGWRLY